MPRPAALGVVRAMLGPAALALGVVPLAAQAAPPAKVAQSVGRVYGAGARVDTMTVDNQTVYRVSRAGTLLGFAEVRNVKGKEQPITYLVAVDSAGAMRDIDILVYRESQGGEVAYDSWRKQFRGKTTDDPIAIGKDIRNISGATISSNAVTRSVRLALRQLADWRAAGKLR
jgi:Na+-translocating ferredoxin:NAD+ oxidoreductase RnfG subunit